MAKKANFDTAFSFTLSDLQKRKATYILWKETGNTLTVFLRTSVFDLIQNYEKKNGEIILSDLQESEK